MTYLIKRRTYVRTGRRRPVRVPLVEVVARCEVFDDAVAAAAQYVADLGLVDEDAVWIEGPHPRSTSASAKEEP